ncbi:MAG: class I SAM-dependent methyltransferase [Crocinitomicaceae bacterium]
MARKQAFNSHKLSKKSFIQQFFKQNKMVGSLIPSSRFLAKKMLKHIPFQSAKVIVELGPGTGIFTEKILQKLNPETQLVVIELNDVFYENLVQKNKKENCHIVHGSAGDLEKILKDLGFEKADCVVSSLPLSNFPKELRVDIMQAVLHCLTKAGTFIQFQYTLQSKKHFKSIFKHVSIEYSALNFPPAFVYRCSNS